MPDTTRVQIKVPQVLTKEQVATCRKVIDDAKWIDGRGTAGAHAAAVKQNMQLPENSPDARQLGEMVLQALSTSPLFISFALPLRVLPPMFNRYGSGQFFGSPSAIFCLYSLGVSTQPTLK